MIGRLQFYLVGSSVQIGEQRGNFCRKRPARARAREIRIAPTVGREGRGGEGRGGEERILGGRVGGGPQCAISHIFTRREIARRDPHRRRAFQRDSPRRRACRVSLSAKMPLMLKKKNHPS